MRDSVLILKKLARGFRPEIGLLRGLIINKQMSKRSTDQKPTDQKPNLIWPNKLNHQNLTQQGSYPIKAGKEWNAILDTQSKKFKCPKLFLIYQFLVNRFKPQNFCQAWFKFYAFQLIKPIRNWQDKECRFKQCQMENRRRMSNFTIPN